VSRELTIFLVHYDEDRTRIDTDDDLMGWGVRFPTGQCYVDWNRRAYDEEDRLDHPHVSIYGSLGDVEQGTGGEVEIVHVRGVGT
jgi:hypothetical protein